MRPAPLVVLLPVLARPHRIRPVLESIEATTPAGTRALFLADHGDEEEILELQSIPPSRLKVQAFVCEPGLSYAAKINLGIEITDEPLIFTGADDLEFRRGWFEAAAGYLTGPVGVVGTQDLCNPKTIAGEHATHFLVGRRYVEECGTVDEPGKLFHEGYPHEYVDNELIATARMRGAYAFADEAVVRHLHPMVDGAPMDSTYRRGAATRRQGRRVYESRRHLWGE